MLSSFKIIGTSKMKSFYYPMKMEECLFPSIEELGTLVFLCTHECDSSL